VTDCDTLHKLVAYGSVMTLAYCWPLGIHVVNTKCCKLLKTMIMIVNQYKSIQKHHNIEIQLSKKVLLLPLLYAWLSLTL